MHPVIRIINLLALAALAPWLPPLGLLLVGLLLLVAGVASSALGSRMLRNLRRVRWLLISLLVLFLWFTPGTPVLPSLHAFSPTVEGIALAAHRMGVLVVMVWAAAVFIGALDAREITAALRWLLAGPLCTAVTIRFAECVGLLLAELPRTERRVRDALVLKDVSLAERAARLLLDVEREAALEPVESLSPLPQIEVPPQQWLMPLSLVAMGVFLIMLGG